jgi:uncharacterized membrane protein YjjP (DUF1212 family)
MTIKGSSDENNKPLQARTHTEASYELVVKFIIAYGTRYLASGGPIPRMEHFLEKGAVKYGYPTQVYATPPVLLMNCAPNTILSSNTFITRVEEQPLNFAELKALDKILRRFSHGKLSIKRALTLLESNYYSKNSYPEILQAIAAFCIGFFSSFSFSGLLLSAVISGAFTLFVHTASLGLRARYGIKGFYFEFLSSLFVIVSSALLSPYVGQAALGMAFGTFIYLVPGLRITTSISEIVSESIISGILRLFKALLTLIAMGLAYIISFDLANLFSVTESLHFMTEHNSPFHFVVQEVCHLGTLLGFAVHFQVPKKFLPHALLTGFLGSLVFHIIAQHNVLILPAFLSAFCMGLISLIFGHLYKIPSQIISTPSILILVPGMLAFSTFDYLVNSDPSQRSSIAFQTLITASAIVFGLITARIPFLRLRKTAMVPREIFDDIHP